jgi:hypothetical protein
MNPEESMDADAYSQHAAKDEKTANGQAIASHLLSDNASEAAGEWHHLNKFFKEFEV